MTVYIDTYVSHPSRDALEAYAAPFVNYIPLLPGRAAEEAYTDEDGYHPAIEQLGDPNLWYTCIRTNRDLTSELVAPFAWVDPALGAQIVGVWASLVAGGDDA